MPRVRATKSRFKTSWIKNIIEKLRWKSFMFADKDNTDSSSSEEASQPGSNNLRRLIENGMRDWQSFKGLHGRKQCLKLYWTCFSSQDLWKWRCGERTNAHFFDGQRTHSYSRKFSSVEVWVKSNFQNEAYTEGKTSFKLGVNHIADLVSFKEYCLNHTCLALLRVQKAEWLFAHVRRCQRLQCHSLESPA